MSELQYMNAKANIYKNANTVLNTEPTYSGEGKLDDEIIEPSGIDLPTNIFKSGHPTWCV